MKKSNILLSENEENKICKVFKDKTTFENVTIFYKIAAFYKLQNLFNGFLCYIERFFTVVAETENFLKLNFAFVSKILSSSSLHITSELEVLKAAEDWLSYNFEERKSFASDLLLKVRLCLLSENSLKCLLLKSSTFRKDERCVKTIQKVLQEESKCNLRNLAARYRCCEQSMFNTLVCGGSSDNVYEISGRKITNETHMTSSRTYFKAVYLKGEVFIFYGNGDSKYLTSVEKYSILTKTWQCVADDDKSYNKFCACGIVDKIYICGGRERDTNKRIDWMARRRQYYPENTVRVFDTKDYSFKQVAKMKFNKSYAACSAYQGKVVVSGGYSYGRYLSVVEAYDQTSDKWVEMPSLIIPRSQHCQVSVRSKLFIIGSFNESCEMLDSDNQRFVFIKKPAKSQLSYSRSFEAVSIGNKIVAYDFHVQKYSSYDVEKNEWSEEDFELTKHLAGFACVKIPQFMTCQ